MKSGASDAETSTHDLEAMQVRTRTQCLFNAAVTAHAPHNPLLFRLTLKRMRPSAITAVEAWRATKPLTNPNTPADLDDTEPYWIPRRPFL